MPADVVPSSSARQASPTCSEIKSGSLILVAANGRKQWVNVRVYHTSLEHFAVVYPPKKICRPMGVINLRNVTVEEPDDNHLTGFKVRQRGYDTPMAVTFLCDSPRDLDAWLNAFSSRSSVTSPPLPIVLEDEEQ